MAPAAARTPRARPRLAVRCPGCGRRAAAEAIHSPGGHVHAGRMESSTLVAHAGCDLWALAGEFTRAARRRSRAPAPVRDCDGGEAER